MGSKEIGVSFIIVIVILLLSLIFYYREAIFGVDLTSDSSPESWLNEGYGYYSDTVKSPCLSIDGKCTSKANQYVIRTCTRNPSTGRGCLIDGKQYFKPQVRKVDCIPQCYISSWDTATSGTCELNYDTCIVSGTFGSQSNIYTCKEIDGTGINGCTIVVPDDTPIPGCTIDNKLVATCNVGAVVTLDEPCIPNGPICGEWRVNGEECVTTVDFNTGVENCKSLITGQRMDSITDLYSLGYYEVDVTCVHNEITGDINCRKGDCETSLVSILDMIGNNNKILSCLNGAPKPSCLNTCFYYNISDILTISSTEFAQWEFLIGKPCFIRSFEPNLAANLDLTLNNIPCSTNSESSLIVNGPSTKYSSWRKPNGEIGLPPLSDGFGDPSKGLLSSEVIGYRPEFIAANSENISIPSCNLQQVRHSTSTIFIFKPINTSIDGSMSCHILGIQALGYTGIMYSEDGHMRWKQATPIDLAGYRIPDSRYFILRPSNNGTFSIRDFENNPVEILSMGNVSFKSQLLENCRVEPINENIVIRDIDGNSTSFNPLKIDPNSDDVLPNFHTFLNYRATRRNPYTCNALYSYPPPEDYLPYDVGLPLYKDDNGDNFWISAHATDEEKPHD